MFRRLANRYMLPPPERVFQIEGRSDQGGDHELRIYNTMLWGVVRVHNRGAFNVSFRRARATIECQWGLVDSDIVCGVDIAPGQHVDLPFRVPVTHWQLPGESNQTTRATVRVARFEDVGPWKYDVGTFQAEDVESSVRSP